jgi:hypothetical protein
MDKALHRSGLDGVVSGWWDNLTEREQNLLITTLYNMSVEDFDMYGIGINEKTNRYIKKRR